MTAYLYYIASYIDLLPVIIFVFLFILFNQVTKEKPLIIITLNCLLSFLILFFSDYVPKSLQHYAYSFFILTEYITFILFLWFNINSSALKKVIVSSSLAFIIFLSIYTILAKIKQIDSLSIGIESILVLSFTFYFLYELVSKPSTTYIHIDYRFWISLGIIIYLASTFFIYIYADQLSYKEISKFWFLTWIFYILKSVFFFIGMLVYYHQPKKNAGASAKASQPFLDMI